MSAAAVVAPKTESAPPPPTHTVPAEVAALRVTIGEDPACIRCNFCGHRDGRPICRRAAPRPGFGSPEDRLWAVWPIVREADWCGEFQPSERLFEPEVIE